MIESLIESVRSLLTANPFLAHVEDLGAEHDCNAVAQCNRHTGSKTHQSGTSVVDSEEDQLSADEPHQTDRWKPLPSTFCEVDQPEEAVYDHRTDGSDERILFKRSSFWEDQIEHLKEDEVKYQLSISRFGRFSH